VSSDKEAIPIHALLDGLLACLYEGISSPNGMQSFVEALIRAFPLRAAMLITRNAETHEMRSIWMVGMNHAWTERYALEFSGEDMLAHHIATAPIARFYASNLDVTTEEQLRKTRFYREWLAPQDIAYAAGAIVLREGPWQTQMFLQRGSQEAPFSREELDLFDRLVPHVQRALQLRERMTELELGFESLRNGLDLLSMAALLFDERGQVTHQNLRAKTLLANNRFARVRDGHFQVADEELSRRLHFEIGSAIQASRGSSLPLHEVMRLPRGEQRPLMLMLAPLGSRGAYGAALLFVFDPEIVPGPAPERVRQLFSLSEAEAALAIALTRGETLEETATSRGVSLNTIKTQLRSVFAKTGTSRQAELVSLLLASPAYFLAGQSAFNAISPI